MTPAGAPGRAAATLVSGRHRLGFLVNPIAGMGGRVGLKGTDDVVEQAIALGAEPTAHLKADEMLRELRTLLDASEIGIEWLTCSGAMGADILAHAGFENVSVVHEPAATTSADDTRQAVRRFVEARAELIVFCGGDGTARDVCSAAQGATPILGVPSGVKMYSGVFGVSPLRTAQIVFGHLRGELELAEAEVLDVDEERYRRGEWAVRLFATARTPFEPTLTQTAKALVAGVSDSEVCDAIADDVIERLDAAPGTLFLLGAGGTVAAIGRRLGIENTLLGIDAVVGRRRIGADLNERDLLQLLDAHPRCVLVLSPIGAQGFVLGRGNQQLSPAVLRKIGADNVLVVATPAKLQRTPLLRFESADRSLDVEFARNGYLPVVTGYHRRRLVKVAT